MLKKICQHCGKQININESCGCGGHSERRSFEDFYSQSVWKRTARAAKQRAGYSDEYIRVKEGRLVEGKIVHHIIPIDDKPEFKLRLDNLIVVSHQTHEMIHQAYNQGGETKRRMQEELLEIRRMGNR